jgi:hypothetical protein
MQVKERGSCVCLHGAWLRGPGMSGVMVHACNPSYSGGRGRRMSVHGLSGKSVRC